MTRKPAEKKGHFRLSDMYVYLFVLIHLCTLHLSMNIFITAAPNDKKNLTIAMHCFPCLCLVYETLDIFHQNCLSCPFTLYVCSKYSWMVGCIWCIRCKTYFIKTFVLFYLICIPKYSWMDGCLWYMKVKTLWKTLYTYSKCISMYFTL